MADAFGWYEEHAAGLGEEFLRATDAVFRSIVRTPLQHALVHGPVRRALMRRFPYGVFYTVGEEDVTVIAVFHASRNPRQWRSRA